MGRQIVVSGAKLDKRPTQSSREEESSESTDADAPTETGGSTGGESTI